MTYLYIMRPLTVMFTNPLHSLKASYEQLSAVQSETVRKKAVANARDSRRVSESCLQVRYNEGYLCKMTRRLRFCTSLFVHT